MYRAWAALGAAGLLSGVAVVALFVGFGSPAFLVLAAVSGAGAFLAYRYASARMVSEVYAEVDPGWDADPDASVTDGGAPTAEAVDGVTAATDPGDAEYDEWSWADVEPDDPFWSEDTDDWTDPWETETTDPSEAAAGDWRRYRRTEETDERDQWWRRAGGEARADRGRDGDGDREGERGDPGAGVRGREQEVRAAYETLGLEPGAGPEAVRAAYRERVKAAHPDTEGGSAEAFIRVREAYELLRERLGGQDDVREASGDGEGDGN